MKLKHFFLFLVVWSWNCWGLQPATPLETEPLKPSGVELPTKTTIPVPPSSVSPASAENPTSPSETRLSYTATRVESDAEGVRKYHYTNVDGEETLSVEGNLPPDFDAARVMDEFSSNVAGKKRTPASLMIPSAPFVPDLFSWDWVTSDIFGIEDTYDPYAYLTSLKNRLSAFIHQRDGLHKKVSEFDEFLQHIEKLTMFRKKGTNQNLPSPILHSGEESSNSFPLSKVKEEATAATSEPLLMRKKGMKERVDQLRHRLAVLQEGMKAKNRQQGNEEEEESLWPNIQSWVRRQRLMTFAEYTRVMTEIDRLQSRINSLEDQLHRRETQLEQLREEKPQQKQPEKKPKLIEVTGATPTPPQPTRIFKRGGTTTTSTATTTPSSSTTSTATTPTPEVPLPTPPPPLPPSAPSTQTSSIPEKIKETIKEHVQA